MLGFKKSVAANSSKGGFLKRVPKNNTLYQVISDNFETETNFQNGKPQTHCLAAILTKIPNLKEGLPHTTFQQLKKEGNTVTINDTYVTELLVYDDSKKTKMVSPEINLPTIFKLEVKKLISIFFCISLLKINAPNILGIVNVLVMIKGLV